MSSPISEVSPSASPVYLIYILTTKPSSTSLAWRGVSPVALSNTPQRPSTHPQTDLPPPPTYHKARTRLSNPKPENEEQCVREFMIRYTDKLLITTQCIIATSTSPQSHQSLNMIQQSSALSRLSRGKKREKKRDVKIQQEKKKKRARKKEERGRL